MKPNIFEFATGELSQDALICWLLEWAKKENAQHCEVLHKTGIKFLDSIFNKFQITDILYQKIAICKQYKKIDILCIINDTYIIIIEDKTDTSNHSNQLVTYKKIVEKKYPKHRLLPIYFKTGTQLNYIDVKKDGYTPYLRDDFLKIIRYAKLEGITNQILLDYSDYLEKIDHESKFAIIPIRQWTIRSWLSFFQYIDSIFGGCGITGYGKSVGLYLHWSEHKKYLVGSYLRIVAKKAQISIKLESTSKPKTKIDNRIKDMFRNAIVEHDSSKITRKANSTGNSATIINTVGDFRKTNSNEFIDKKETINNLKSIMQLLDLSRTKLQL